MSKNVISGNVKSKRPVAYSLDPYLKASHWPKPSTTRAKQLQMVEQENQALKRRYTFWSAFAVSGAALAFSLPLWACGLAGLTVAGIAWFCTDIG